MMAHINWWLCALSFGLGLLLTLALIIRALRTEAPPRPVAGRPNRVQELPANDMFAADESPTTMIPVESPDEEYPTTKIPVDQDFATTKIPIAQDYPTTKIPVTQDFPTTKIRVTNDPAAEKDFPTTKIPITEEPPTIKTKAVPYAPYGPGSARADADGAGPSGWLIKGRTDTRHYFTPEDATYDQTVAQVWFKDEQSASRALFTPWQRSSKKG